MSTARKALDVNGEEILEGDVCDHVFFDRRIEVARVVDGGLVVDTNGYNWIAAELAVLHDDPLVEAAPAPLGDAPPKGGRAHPAAHAAVKLLGDDGVRAVAAIPGAFGPPEAWSVAKVGGLWTLLDADGDPLVCLPARYADRPDAVPLLWGLAGAVAVCRKLLEGDLDRVPEDIPLGRRN